VYTLGLTPTQNNSKLLRLVTTRKTSDSSCSSLNTSRTQSLRDRDGEGEYRQIGTQIDTHRYTHTHTHTHTHTNRERERERNTQRETQRERESREINTHTQPLLIDR